MHVTTTRHSLPLGRAAWAAPLLALLACAEDRMMEEVTETPISSTGGLARSFDGRLSIEFPPGALASGTLIRVATEPAHDKDELVSPVYDISPRRSLAQAATLRISASGPGPKTLVEVDSDGTLIPVGPDIARSENEVAASITFLAAYAVASAGSSDAGVVDAGPTADAGARAMDGGEEADAGTADIGPEDTGVEDTGSDSGLESDAGGGFADASTSDGGGGIEPGPPATTNCGLVPIAEAEPNDAVASATTVATLDINTPLAGDISSGDIDVFAVFRSTTIPSLELRTHTRLGDPGECSGLDSMLELLDANGRVIASNDDARGTTCSALSFTSTVGPSLYVRITARSATPTPYFVTAYEARPTGASGPDLDVIDVVPAYTTWRAGSMQTATVCMRNLGDQPMPSTTTALRLGSTPGGTIQLVVAPSPALPPGAVGRQFVAFTAPTSLPVPTDLHAIGDFNATVIESREVNNVARFMGTIRVVP